MLGKAKRAIKRVAGKAAPTAVALLALGQTTSNTTQTTTSGLDMTAIIDVLVTVIPLFVLVAVIRMLFQAFKQAAE